MLILKLTFDAVRVCGCVWVAGWVIIGGVTRRIDRAA
jgi:hypothetical protein